MQFAPPPVTLLFKNQREGRVGGTSCGPLVVCSVQCWIDSQPAVCERLSGTDFHHRTTRDFFTTRSRVSGSSVSPRESCKFGATSWLEELDDGVSNNFARVATVSSVTFQVLTFVRLLVSESHAFRVSGVNISVMSMTLQKTAR